MSLAQYLALGNSIKQVSGPGRYKLPAGPVLPRFEGWQRERMPGKRPGGGTAGKTPVDASPAPVAKVAERVESLPSVPVEAAPVPAETGAPVSAPIAAPVRGRWLLQPRSRRDEQSPLPRQGELALGLVQPVRNDLRDSDWEVVPVKAAPTPGPARPSWWARFWQWCRARWRRSNRRSR
ncbi:MAG: hypothetical protein N3J91_13375 [Verrucomicrobiae bacterium]|nr:hypothetical protein [Verrucomicrobiae bacterium]